MLDLSQERVVMIEGRPRILAVEDDPEEAQQLVELLSTSGYQIELAADGNEGLSRGRSADYAVMTIDRMLPGMDGLAIIPRMREDGIATPALIISALGEIDDLVRGLRAGGDDYLVKPFAFPNCWPAWRRWPDAAPPWSKRPCCVSVISEWTWCREP